MPTVKFRGKEYNSLADMPAKVRHDYFKVKAGYDVPEEETKSKTERIPAGIENMPDEVRTIYERVRGKENTKPVQTSPVDELPRTEDLYHQSAPPGMQDQPSDEVIYKPSPPLIGTPPPIIESEPADQTLQGLAIGLAILMLVLGIVLFFYFSV